MIVRISRPSAAARFLLPILLLAAPHCREPLRAADGSWLSGRTGILDWFDIANWNLGTVPGTTSGTVNADTATFGSNTGAATITIDAGRNLRSLLFSGTNEAGSFTLGGAGANGGEALRLSSGGSITLALNQRGGVVVHAPLVLEAASPTTNGTYTITNNSTDVSGTTDTNLSKLSLLGDIRGGTTTGSITLNFTGSAGNRSSNPSANVVSGLISNGDAVGGLAVTVTGTALGDRGAWSFTNNGNSYTGATTLGAGTLIFTSIGDSGVNSALGAGSLLTLNAGAQAKYVGGTASTNRTIVSNGGLLYSAGGGTLTINGSLTVPGGITFRGGNNFIIDTIVSGNGGMSRTDGGTVFLERTNTFLGNLSIQDGAFRFASIADKLVPSPIGAGSTITFGQNSSTVGRIEFTGASGGSSNRDIVLNNGNGASSGNGRIDNTVAGQTLVLSGWVRASNSTASFVSSLNLTGVGDGIMSGIIGGTTASPTTPTATALSKTGTGTWALSNANLYTGGTTISAGTLLALNTIGSATGSGNVSTSGSGGLGGTGIVTGAAGGSITIATGTRLMIGTTHGLAAGAAGPVGTTSAPSQLTLGSATDVALTLAGNLQFDLFTGSNGLVNGTSDLLVLRSTASAITLGGTLVLADLSPAHSPWRQGRWRLLDWSGLTGTRSGTFSYNTTALSLASGYGIVDTDVLTTGEIRIGKVAENHTWTGTSSASWANPENWEIGTLPTSSTDVFFGSAPILTSNIDGDKNVRNLFFDGSADHVINATGGVLYSAGTHLEVLGGSQRFNTAQLRVSNGNVGTYHIVNDGLLRFDQPILYHRTSGSGNVVIAFSGSGTTTIHHVLRRSGTYDASLRFEGPGTVTFTNSSATPAGADTGAITGTTTITGGKVRMNNELNLGLPPAAFNPAQLTLDGGTLAAYATFAIDDANRGITLGGAGGGFEVEGSHILTLDVTIAGAGGLNKSGPGTLILGGDNLYTGTTEVEAGTLRVNGNQSAADGPVFVRSGATLAGTGVLGGDTTLDSGAFLNAGNGTAPGLLTFEDDLTLAAGSTWLVDLVHGGTADRINVNGHLTLGGSLSIAATGGFLHDATYFIAGYGSLGGNGFSNDIAWNPSLLTGRIDGGNGTYWDINYNNGGVISLTAVPEPGTLLTLLAFLGSGGWIARRRRSRRRSAD